MRGNLVIALAWAILAALTTAPGAEGRHTPEEAKALVEKAAAFYRTAGREKALVAFNDPAGGFVDGDLYVFALDAADGNMTSLAHTNKTLIGRPQIAIEDAEGKAFIREMAEKLTTSDAAWIEYKWPHPETKKVAAKRSYVVKVGDVILGAGAYE